MSWLILLQVITQTICVYWHLLAINTIYIYLAGCLLEIVHSLKNYDVGYILLKVHVMKNMYVVMFSFYVIATLSCNGLYSNSKLSRLS